MPHIRKRYLRESVLHALKHSPLVGVLGHRQVGKTTLLQQLTHHCFSFDDESILERVIRGAKTFLEDEAIPIGSGSVALDECQLAPPLFPALKERIRKSQRPGQFLLSGSIRFTSRKAIRESLTGRIVNFDLHPMSIAELESRPLPDTCQRLLAAPSFERNPALGVKLSNHRSKAMRFRVNQYLENGGLPGVCMIREAAFREKKIQEQLFTILDRDLRQIHPTSLTYPELLAYAKELAHFEGLPLSQSDIRRATGISPAAQKKLFFAFESLFLIRPILIEGGRKGLTLFFEDQAEQRFLSGSQGIPLERLSALLYRNIRTEWAYRLGSSPRFFHYLTRGGARVPFSVEHQGSILGFIPITGDSPDKSARASASSFLRAYGNAKMIFFSVDRQFQPYAHDPRALVIPIENLL